MNGLELGEFSIIPSANDSMLPALYKAADDAANRYQTQYLWLIRGYLTLLVLGSIASAYSDYWQDLTTFATVAFVIVLTLAIVLLVTSGPKKWYYARALAESIKTLAWKYMMAADPYRGSDARDRFAADLHVLLRQDDDIGHILSGHPPHGDTITEIMDRVRDKQLQDRLVFYLKHRIEDQLAWYRTRSKQNRKAATYWFLTMIGLLLVTLLRLILSTRIPALSFVSIEVLASTVTSILTWTQVRRFQELSAAYTLAAAEICIIKNLATDVDSEDTLSTFVSDAENAFSREHTQWQARRG